MAGCKRCALKRGKREWGKGKRREKKEKRRKNVDQNRFFIFAVVIFQIYKENCI